jgi:sugar-phosphatase
VIFRPGALIFDMDGLMVDSEPLWFAVEKAFCAARGGDWTHAHARACIGRGMAATLRAMGDAFGVDIDIDRDAAIIVEDFIARAPELALKPGCIELLDRARGKVPIAVASSSARGLIDAVLGRFDLAARFDAIVSGEIVAHPKPAPDIFLLAAEKLGVAASACAVLEDSIAGVTAGRAAGMFVIAVPEGDPRDLDFARVSDVVVASLFAASDHLAL